MSIQQPTNLFESTKRFIAQLEILNEVQGYIVGREAETKAYVQCVNNLKLEIEKIEYYLSVKSNQELEDKRELKRKLKEKENEAVEKMTMKDVANWNKELTEREMNLHYLVTTGFKEINENKFGPLLERVFNVSALINTGREKLGISPFDGLKQSLQEYTEEKVIALENEAQTWVDSFEGSTGDDSLVVELKREVTAPKPSANKEAVKVTTEDTTNDVIKIVAATKTEGNIGVPAVTTVPNENEAVMGREVETESVSEEDAEVVEDTTVEEFVNEVSDEVENHIQPEIDATAEEDIQPEMEESTTTAVEETKIDFSTRKKRYKEMLNNHDQTLVNTTLNENEQSMYSINNVNDTAETNVDAVEVNDVSVRGETGIPLDDVSGEAKEIETPFDIEETKESEENTTSNQVDILEAMGGESTPEEMESLNSSYNEQDFEGQDDDEDEDEDEVIHDPEEHPDASQIAGEVEAMARYNQADEKETGEEFTQGNVKKGGGFAF